ncbi:hypothetical protein GCM10027570_29980 [Streptomonospora sediminis]
MRFVADHRDAVLETGLAQRFGRVQPGHTGTGDRDVADVGHVPPLLSAQCSVIARRAPRTAGAIPSCSAT